MSDLIQKQEVCPVQISHQQQLWQTKLKSRCHRSRQKPWKLLRKQKVPGRASRVIGRLPVPRLGRGTSARESPTSRGCS